MESSPAMPRVCVTGGGGFIASWLVKLLLSRGYAVHATVRDPCDPKNAFLKQLDGAPENLRLFKADMLDYDTLTPAFAGCDGVFHVATPVPDGKLLDPEIWYGLAKTEAEEIALEYGKRNGLHVVTICPGVVFGPLLQHVVPNTTSKVLLYIIKGGPDTMSNKSWPIVDVRDVADALLLLYNKAGSSERYICSLDQLDMKDLVEILKKMYPNYSYADKMVDMDYTVEMTSDKLRNMGWKTRKLEETLADSIESYKQAGFLHASEPCRLPFFFVVPTVQE